MVGIVGKKVGMTSVYKGDKLIPCTVIQVLPCKVSQIKSTEQDAYNAVQVAYGVRKSKNMTKPVLGHLASAKISSALGMVEFRQFPSKIADKEVVLGMDLVVADLFEEGEYIDVVGVAKGHGFSGVMKRHGFSGVGDRTHGQHNRERAPGSIGGASYPSRVFPGMRMAGRHGGGRVKVKNLEVLSIQSEQGLILVRGAVPGAKKNYIILQK